MNTRTTLLACALAAVGTCAWAEGPLSPSWEATSAGGFTPSSTHVMGAGPGVLKGGLSRADVIAEIQQARRDGTLLPAGEAIGYPFQMKAGPAATMSAQTPESTVMGAPPQDGTTLDGYRFIGGEAGYERVVRPQGWR